MGDSRASDPLHSSQPEEPPTLSYIFPLLLLCSGHSTESHSSVRGYLFPEDAKEGRVSKTSHSPLPGVSSLCTSKHRAFPGRFVSSAVWFISSAPPAAFHTSQVSSAPISSLPPPSLYPHSYCVLYSGPRPPPTVDHPPLPF